MDLRTLRYFVAVAEELHFGRAAARLRMTQPPLSRAVRQLEAGLGTELLRRSTTGVALTPAGTALHEEALALLDQAERARRRVIAAAAGEASLTLGVLADSAEQAGARLASAYRRRHHGVRVVVREADFADPTAGLRAGLVDVALTRTPFDETGLTTHVLRSDPVGVVLRADDPLAHHGSLRLDALADRAWFRLPEGTDPLWSAYWCGGSGGSGGSGGAGGAGPVVRTVHECLQAVLWSGVVGIAPLTHALPDGLTAVPLLDMEPSSLVVAWSTKDTRPLTHAFLRLATALA